MFLLEKRTTRRLILCYFFIIPFAFLYANSQFPPLGKTGAPGNGSCTECHTNRGTANPGHVILDFGRLAYVPGVKQTIWVRIYPERDMPFTGFQLTARLESDSRQQAGHFEPGESTAVQMLDGIEYVSHARPAIPDTRDGYAVTWTAPPASAGNVRFYVVAVAGHANGSPDEAVYSASRTLPPGLRDLPAGYRWESFSFQNSSTTIYDLTSDGQIFGTFNSGGRWFRRGKDGIITTFNTYPGSGMNAAGKFVGYESNAGFIREPNGSVTTFSVPGSDFTRLFHVNDAGVVAGLYSKDSNSYLLRSSSPPHFDSFRLPDTRSSLSAFALTASGSILAGHVESYASIWIAPDGTMSGASICRTAGYKAFYPRISANDAHTMVGTCAHDVDWYNIIAAENGRLLRLGLGDVEPVDINEAGQIAARHKPDNGLLLTPCTTSPQNTSASISAAGGTFSIALNGPADCRANATSETSWISVTSFQESTQIRYFVGANTAIQPRVGSFWAAGREITVAQAAGTCPDLSLQIWATLSVAAEGGQRTIRITAPAGCLWTISTNVPWITILDASSGSGPAEVRVAIAPNPNESSRNGAIVVSGATLPVIQSPLCIYRVTPTSLQFPAEGATISLQVNAAAGCPWTWSRGSNSNWLATVTETTFSGSREFPLSTFLNTTASTRRTTITIAGQSVAITQAPWSSGLVFVPMPPCRAADTRVPSNAYPSRLDANSTGAFRPFVFCSDYGFYGSAFAFSLNLTAIPTGPLSFLSAYPGGTERPWVSTLNSFNGRVVANAAIVPAGDYQNVEIFTTSSTDIVMDINGYFARDTDYRGLAFYPVTPCRAADTRLTTGARQGASTFPIAGPVCGIPASAAAYSLNVTAVPSGPLSFLSLWPAGQAQPLVSTLNSYDGQVVANAAIVPAGVNGSVSVFNSDPSNTVIDVNGYFAPPGAPGGLRFYTVVPCRIADTRDNSGMTGPFGAPQIPAGGTRQIPVPQSGCGIPQWAKAYALNITAVPPGPLGYVSVWPAGSAQPTVSTLNSFNGQVVANAAIVPAGTNGAILFYASSPTDLVIDINGYFAP